MSSQLNVTFVLDFDCCGVGTRNYIISPMSLFSSTKFFRRKRVTFPGFAALCSDLQVKAQNLLGLAASFLVAE